MKVPTRCAVCGLTGNFNLTRTQPNSYTVCVSDKGREGYLHRICSKPLPHVDGDRLSVTFSSNHENARSPDPLLLALHATCAWVAHMSGDAEAFYELERDVEDMRVLAFDESSA